MEKENYIDLILDISKYYNCIISSEITKSGQSYIKILKNSIYGSQIFIDKYQSRKEKLDKIINKI